MPSHLARQMLTLYEPDEKQLRRVGYPPVPEAQSQGEVGLPDGSQIDIREVPSYVVCGETVLRASDSELRTEEPKAQKNTSPIVRR